DLKFGKQLDQRTRGTAEGLEVAVFKRSRGGKQQRDICGELNALDLLRTLALPHSLFRRDFVNSSGSTDLVWTRRRRGLPPERSLRACCPDAFLLQTPKRYTRDLGDDGIWLTHQNLLNLCQTLALRLQLFDRDELKKMPPAVVSRPPAHLR